MTPGRDSSQARASAVGVTSSSAASASYASRLVRCWAIRCSRALWELTLKCPEFPKWWSQHRVLDRTWGHKRFRHPVVGPLEIDYEALHLPGDPDQTLFVYRAPDGDTRSAEALTLLASWNAESTTDRTPASQRSHRPTAT